MVSTREFAWVGLILKAVSRDGGVDKKADRETVYQRSKRRRMDVIRHRTFVRRSVPAPRPRTTSTTSRRGRPVERQRGPLHRLVLSKTK